ncbi:MAG: hypothetical protein C4518_06905 [Desulfobacteraceae bacterium]|nr:MAG: hypothetical protein C4518_06905 [Desulfobacteraceae bacterium]
MNKWTLYQKGMLIIACAFLLFIFSFSGSDYGVQLTLTWDKPADSRVTGYNIYWGIYGNEFKAKPVQTINLADKTSILLSGLEEGKTYSIAVTSIDGKGNESVFSETITYTMISSNNIDDDRDGYTENGGDCNDADASIHPGSIEICGDGVDQDCNGKELPCIKAPEDIDKNEEGHTENQGDSNGNDSSIHPAVIVICGDNISQEDRGLDTECLTKKKNGDSGCFIHTLSMYF